MAQKKKDEVIKKPNWLRLFPSRIGYSWTTILGTILIILFLAYVLFFQRHWLTSPTTVEYVRILVWPLLIVFAIVVVRPFVPSLVEGRDLVVRYKEVALSLVNSQEQKTVLTKPKRKPAKKGPANPTATPEPSALTAEQKESAFGVAANIIFGTQISAMLRMQAYGALQTNDLQDLYELHRRLLPGSPYVSVLDLLRFPVAQQLVKRNSQGSYELGLYGNEFLAYLVRHNIDLNGKPN